MWQTVGQPDAAIHRLACINLIYLATNYVNSGQRAFEQRSGEHDFKEKKAPEQKENCFIEPNILFVTIVLYYTFVQCICCYTLIIFGCCQIIYLDSSVISPYRLVYLLVSVKKKTSNAYLPTTVKKKKLKIVQG